MAIETLFRRDAAWRKKLSIDAFMPRHDPVPGQLDDASKTIRFGAFAVLGFFGIFMLFALIVPISGAAVAIGEVTTSGTRIVIQPEAGGVINTLFVGEGQRVKAGQPLVRLNGIRSAAAAQQAQARRDALRALQARLIAQRDGMNGIAFPPDFTIRGTDPAASSAMSAQLAIFQRHQAIRQADRDIAATQQATADAQRASAVSQLALIRDELAGIRELYGRGFARKTQLRALERAEAELIAETATGGNQVQQTALQSSKLADEQAMQTVTELARVEEQLAQVDPALRVTKYDAARDTLSAPLAGRVSSVARLGPGSVVRPGQTIMEVIPDNRTMIIETRIKPSDIDDVRLGSPATLRFSTVNPRGKNAFEGKVISLSPARVAEEGGEGYFKTQIAVTDVAALRASGIELMPGVPVTVTVNTSNRTLFDYLFAPISDAFNGAFTEE